MYICYLKRDYLENRTLLFYVQEEFADVHEPTNRFPRTINSLYYIANYVIDIDSGDILKCRGENALSQAHLNVQAVHQL